MYIKKIAVVLFLSLLLADLCLAQVRIVNDLNDGWKFSKGKNEQAYQVNFIDKDWQTVWAF